MKIIKQFGIIFSLCWIATVIEGLLPIAFPASVIAMLLLLICVITTVITFAATAYSIRLTIWLLGRRKGADR